MLIFHESTQIYLCGSPCDMRKAIDGLSQLVIEYFGIPLQSKAIFLFCNRSKDKVKALMWDKNGFILHYKRLEQGRFKFSPSSSKVIELTAQQLSWLLAGLDFNLMHQFNELDYTHYY